jgi:hypothetical protein
MRAVGTGQLVWANISFTYTAQLLGQLKPEELQVYWWDTQGKTWMSTDHGGVITAQNLVWANVTHLTVFAPRAQTVPVIVPASDTTAPTVSIVYPSNQASIVQGSVKLVGQASDNKGLFSVQVKVDSGTWVDVLVPTGAQSAGWVYDMNLGTGKHTISVRAKDQAGNVGTVTSITLNITKEKTETGGVSMMNILGAIMALIIVALVVLLVYFIGKASEKDKGAAKVRKEDTEETLDEEE